jgi:arginase family enzyme
LRTKYENDLKVIWVDAHPDYVDPQRNILPYTQNYHGLPLSHLTGVAKIPNLPYFSWLN